MTSALLFIHGSLGLGGIETFLVRLAEQRQREGLLTRVLLLGTPSNDDPQLMARLLKAGEVFHLSDICAAWIPIAVHPSLALIVPLRRTAVDSLVAGVDHMHSAGGLGALVAARLAVLASRAVGITIGLYHSKEFAWADEPVPYFEACNQTALRDMVGSPNTIVFNESVIDIYRARGLDLSEASLFPLGVVSKINKLAKDADLTGFRETGMLKICSVGRLVAFKSYNLWMIEVVSALTAAGLVVTYDIFGTGDMRGSIENKIADMGLSDSVTLRGPMPYDDFDKVVSTFDIFVGSGTAIIQASSIGIPSIVAIEAQNDPVTYGFFGEIAGFSYNEKGLGELYPVFDLVMRYKSMSNNEKSLLANNHLKKASMFSIEECSKNFSKSNVNIHDYKYFRRFVTVSKRIGYTVSYILFRAFLKLSGASYSELRYGR